MKNAIVKKMIQNALISHLVFIWKDSYCVQKQKKIDFVLRWSCPNWLILIDSISFSGQMATRVWKILIPKSDIKCFLHFIDKNLTKLYFRSKMTNGRPSRIEIVLFIVFMMSLICVYQYTLNTPGQFSSINWAFMYLRDRDQVQGQIWRSNTKIKFHIPILNFHILSKAESMKISDFI